MPRRLHVLLAPSGGCLAGSGLVGVRRRLRGGHAQHGNAAAAHGLNEEAVPVLLHDVAGTRELVGALDDEAGDGLVLLVVLGGPAEVDGIVQREAPSTEPLAV